ncbi:hypothetical protein [Planctomyces sp. SH-PL62]|uniref:hypothetical protein n=1 Tax=Planctomyces sp. SH-PL62 TaxID=1636152 RepID=UPI00078D20E1|nr:hypothetical protein [Planctomyces sp. SH-PL62]AMV38697.1 hypothetical protein VT85_14760 [Planctomyces sp. SH-PL62]
MARCDQGYLCSVCGEEVEVLLDSELYLRYVLGEVDPELLPKLPERHLRCNPSLAQFIVDESFAAVVLDGPFAKAALDPSFVAEEEARVTAGYRRLLELSGPDRAGSIWDYPLANAREAPDRSEDSPTAEDGSAAGRGGRADDRGPSSR